MSRAEDIFPGALGIYYRRNWVAERKEQSGPVRGRVGVQDCGNCIILLSCASVHLPFTVKRS